MPDNSSQGASVELGVVWYDYLTERLITSHDHVASCLAFEIEAGSLKGFDALPAGNLRQLTHTVSTSTSKRSSGTGRPSS